MVESLEVGCERHRYLHTVVEKTLQIPNFAIVLLRISKKALLLYPRISSIFPCSRLQRTWKHRLWYLACTNTYARLKGSGSISSQIFAHLRLCPIVSALLDDLHIVSALTALLRLTSLVVVVGPQFQDEYSNPREVACVSRATVNSVALAPNEVLVECLRVLSDIQAFMKATTYNRGSYLER